MRGVRHDARKAGLRYRDSRFGLLFLFLRDMEFDPIDAGQKRTDEWKKFGSALRWPRQTSKGLSASKISQDIESCSGRAKMRRNA
jgi:hypothetical protein